jgi:hypothetical protein
LIRNPEKAPVKKNNDHKHNRSMKKIFYTSIFVLASIALVGIIQACSDEDPTTANPQVKSFTPETGGPVGTYVTISGNFFGVKKDNTVTFNGAQATVISATANTITTLVPPGASTGPITVVVDGYTGATKSSFTVTSGTPPPAIVSIDPSTGNGGEGTEVTIKGYNFSATAANNLVQFVGEPPVEGAPAPLLTATVSGASATELKVKAPAGTRTGKIKVTVGGVLTSSPVDFGVLDPIVENFTPKFSIVGGTVIVTGKNFSKVPAGNVVTFNGTPAIPVEASSTSLSVLVPAGATTGKIKVFVDGVDSKESEVDFTVN